MIGIQIIAMVFAFWMIYVSYLHFRRKEFERREFLFWEILWLGFVFVVLFPNSIDFILNTFSISRAFDVVIIIAMIVLSSLSFQNHITIRILEKKIEDYVREEALRKLTNS